MHSWVQSDPCSRDGSRTKQSTWWTGICFWCGRVMVTWLSLIGKQRWLVLLSVIRTSIAVGWRQTYCCVDKRAPPWKICEVLLASRRDSFSFDRWLDARRMKRAKPKISGWRSWVLVEFQPYGTAWDEWLWRQSETTTTIARRQQTKKYFPVCLHHSKQSIHLVIIQQASWVLLVLIWVRKTLWFPPLGVVVSMLSWMETPTVWTRKYRRSLSS